MSDLRIAIYRCIRCTNRLLTLNLMDNISVNSIWGVRLYMCVVCCVWWECVCCETLIVFDWNAFELWIAILVCELSVSKGCSRAQLVYVEYCTIYICMYMLLNGNDYCGALKAIYLELMWADAEDVFEEWVIVFNFCLKQIE